MTHHVPFLDLATCRLKAKCVPFTEVGLMECLTTVPRLLSALMSSLPTTSPVFILISDFTHIFVNCLNSVLKEKSGKEHFFCSGPIELRAPPRARIASGGGEGLARKGRVRPWSRGPGLDPKGFVLNSGGLRGLPDLRKVSSHGSPSVFERCVGVLPSLGRVGTVT